MDLSVTTCGARLPLRLLRLLLLPQLLLLPMSRAPVSLPPQAADASTSTHQGCTQAAAIRHRIQLLLGKLHWSKCEEVGPVACCSREGALSGA